LKYPNVPWPVSQIGNRYNFAAMIGHPASWLSRRLLTRVPFAPDRRLTVQKSGIVWLASQMTETKIVLMCVLLIAIAYAFVLVRKRRQFDLNELTLVIVDVVAVIAGVSMFVYAFNMPDTLFEQAKWTGIAGLCMAMLFFFQSVSVVRKVLASQGASRTEKNNHPAVSQGNRIKSGEICGPGLRQPEKHQ
jgi:hypothetical protein